MYLPNILNPFMSCLLNILIYICCRGNGRKYKYKNVFFFYSEYQLYNIFYL